MYYQAQKSACTQSSAPVGRTDAMDYMALKSGGPCIIFGSHLTARRWGSGPQNLHRIAATAQGGWTWKLLII